MPGGNNAASDDPDADTLDNQGEYVFGGNPTDGADVGTQPVFDAATGDYSYVLRSDDSLTASVLTRSDLVTGSWTTNAPMGITLNDGGLGSYTNNIGTAEDQQFFKLLVE